MRSSLKWPIFVYLQWCMTYIYYFAPGRSAKLIFTKFLYLLWLSPLLTAWWYVKYFWFCGWHHVFIAWISRPESSMTLYFDKDHQVAASVGCQTTSVSSSSSECNIGVKVCYLWFPCYNCGSVVVYFLTRFYLHCHVWWMMSWLSTK